MKNRQLKLVLVFILVFLGLNKAFSQEPAKDFLPKIMPASPEAFKLGSYGNIPIGLFTGAPNINIPILTFNNGSINIPISLNYSTNGIRLDEMNGSVGLGWNLISAGVITRTVRDLPDENSSNLYALPDIDSLGLWSPGVVNYINQSQIEGNDSEPDVYMANFAGNSIKFVFNKNGRPSIISKSNFQIIGESGGNSFTLISNTGVTYEFSARENSIFTNSGSIHPEPLPYTSAWFLSKIKSPDGNEVYIDYASSTYNTTLSQSATMKFTRSVQTQYVVQDGICLTQTYTVPANVETANVISSKVLLSGKQIERIYSKDTTGSTIKELAFTYESVGNIDFNTLKSVKYNYLGNEIAGFNFDYFATTNGRLFLKSINNLKAENKYEFEYINKELLPKRLSFATSGVVSFSRDFWGLYNGKSNTTLIPQIYEANDPNGIKYAGADQSFDPAYAKSGLLNKIIYPTKGSTEIFYEPHVRKESRIISGLQNTITLQATSTDDYSNKIVSDEITIIPKKDELIKIYVPNANRMLNCTDIPDEGKTQGKLLATSNDVSVPIYKYSATTNTYLAMDNNQVDISPQMGEHSYYIYLKKDIPLKITLSTRWICTNVNLNFSYSYTDDTTEIVDVPFGGFRIASTVDDPLVGNSITRNYSYSDINVLREPYYLEEQTYRSYCGPNYIDLKYFTLTSSNLNQLNATSPNIFYGTVTEEIQGKGKTIHSYDTSSDYFGKTLIGKDISTSPWTNFGWKNGKEIITTYKDKLGNKVKEVNYNYGADETKTNSVDGISVRKNFILNYTNSVTIKCTKDNINYVFIDHACIANHNHFWTPAYGNSWKCIAAGNNNVEIRYPSLCNGHTIDEVIIQPNIFENLDVVQYKNISRLEYLKSQKTTDFLNGQQIQTTTEYFYDNPNDYQLSSQKTTFPDGSISMSSYKYAQEKGNQRLIDANMVAIPLETISTKNGKSLGKTETLYNNTNNLFPSSVLSYNIKDLNDTAVLNPPSTTEVTYNQYDDKGNLLQYTTKSGIPVAIIWGYNQTYPIAKIEGATYTEVSNLATALTSASNVDAQINTEASDTTFRSALDTFRQSGTLAGFQITTYSNDPQIGVKSITTPSGIREIYRYDTANRLQSVVDVNNNILKEYKYNYKP